MSVFSDFLQSLNTIILRTGDVDGFGNALLEVNEYGGIQVRTLIPKALLDTHCSIEQRRGMQDALASVMDQYLTLHAIMRLVQPFYYGSRVPAPAWSALNTFIIQGGKTQRQRQQEDDGRFAKRLKLDREAEIAALIAEKIEAEEEDDPMNVDDM